MADKAKAATRKKRGRKARCQHYWIIETPNGPTSKGVCKHCGATKKFDNYWPYSTWERDASRLQELPVLRNMKSRDMDDS